MGGRNVKCYMKTDYKYIDKLYMKYCLYSNSYKHDDSVKLWGYIWQILYIYIYIYLLLSLPPQPSLGLCILQKIWLNFLEASQQFSSLQGRVVSPTPNPHPGGPGLCIYIPQRQGGPVIPLGTRFSCLLQHSWVTVGLFLFPDHHMGNIYIYIYIYI
jgi:hypothetical protein